MKNKTVLLVGVEYLSSNDQWLPYAKKVEGIVREAVGGSKKKLPILVYNKNQMDLSLMELPR